MSYDYQNCINYAVETAVEAAVKTATEKALADGIAKGLSEGEEKGKAEGLAEGKNEARCETARNLLKMGITAMQIAQATGLSEEEVLKLKSEQLVQTGAPWCSCLFLGRKRVAVFHNVATRIKS